MAVDAASMIFVLRRIDEAPLEFIAAASIAFEKLAIDHDRLRTRQSRLLFDLKLLSHPQLLQMLGRTFRGTCAFCETRLSDRENASPSLFRPSDRAQQLDGSVDVDHYWWLAYNWLNIYLVCEGCRSHKGSRFPVARHRAARSDDDADSVEQRLILDPCRDRKLAEELTFTPEGILTGKTRRASVTIDVCGLNRKALVGARREHAQDANAVFGSLMTDGKFPQFKELSAFIDACVARLPYRYIGLTRQLAGKCWNDVHAPQPASRAEKLETAAKTPSAASAPSIVTVSPKSAKSTASAKGPKVNLATTTGAIWLQRVEVENFKALRKLEIAFPESTFVDVAQFNAEPDIAKGSSATRDQQPWLMLLGENGVGKSSLLKAIALALMPKRDWAALKLNPREWVTSGASSGCIRLNFTTESEALELQFSRRSSRIVVKGEMPDVPVLGYGSTRLLPPKSRRHRAERVRVRTLFDPRSLLVDAEPWLADARSVPREDFKLLAISLKELLSLANEDEIERRSARLFANVTGYRGPIRDLSDGYQSVLALALDMMFHLSDSTFDMESVEGTVLLDEVETHLHPRWKVRIVAELRRLFPRVRFIVTTHDPLCVQGLRPGELHVLTRREEDNEVVIQQFDVKPGMRSDQILTGAWFGVTSTRDAETQNIMQRHAALLQKTDRSDVEQREFDQLDVRMRERLTGYSGTEDEQLALKVAAEFRKEQRTRLGKDGELNADDLREKVRAALTLAAAGGG